MAVHFLILTLLLTVTSAQQSVVQQLQSSGFSGFVGLLEAADLLPSVESALASGQPLTIFCPTDDALLLHTSPTLLAFLKLPHNRDTLRKVLLTHFVTERLSPFHWEGAHPTLQGIPLPLRLGSDAFYVDSLPVTGYNALLSPQASVHSIPSLLLPPGLASDASSMLHASADVRRVLAGALAAAPAPGGPLPDDSGEAPLVTPKPAEPSELAAPAGAAASLATLLAALALALVF